MYLRVDSSAEIVQRGEQYLHHLVIERGVSTNTQVSYRRDIERYLNYLLDNNLQTPAEITTFHIEEFLSQLRQGTEKAKPMTARSVNRVLAAVRGLHKFMVTENRLVDDVAKPVGTAKIPQHLPNALDVGQVEKLLDAPSAAGPVGLRDRALLEFLYATGARITEAVSLDVDDIISAVDAGGMDVVRLFGKGSKERIVPMGSHAVYAINAWLRRGRPGMVAKGKGTPALFINQRGGRLSRQSGWSILKTAAEHAGIESAISPHTLRHCFATHLIEGGADVRVVQELLGHSSVTTTQIYTMITADTLREVFATAHPRARG